MRLKKGRISLLALALLAAVIGAAATRYAPFAPAQSVPPSAAQLAEADSAIENPMLTPAGTTLTLQDQAFLDDLEHRGTQFFIDEADPVTGLMPDRAKADGGAVNGNGVASIASVGFGLTALCIGDEHGWMSHPDAYNHCLRVISFLRDHGPQEHGYFYHFLDMHTGRRAWNCEVSSIDTALLIAGVLTVRQHFPDTELATIADDLFERVDWPWLLDANIPGRTTPPGILCMGWNPEHGFINADWRDFNEGPLIYLLAMGSRNHPIPPASWQAWKRQPVANYEGLTYLQCPPLFTHQYPQCWFDLRGLRDDYADYFRDSQLATLAQRQWCMDELHKQFPSYGPNMWGITASDSANGYKAWGGPPQHQGEIDGSVVPAAAAGSLAFEPRLCLDALESMKQHNGDKAYLKYGFVDAFNPSGWYNADVLGIDVGPAVLMAENCRSAFVWKTFMSSTEARVALKAAGFRSVGSQDALAVTTSLYQARN